jgi:hypothetical protein
VSRKSPSTKILFSSWTGGPVEAFQHDLAFRGRLRRQSSRYAAARRLPAARRVTRRPRSRDAHRNRLSRTAGHLRERYRTTITFAVKPTTLTTERRDLRPDSSAPNEEKTILVRGGIAPDEASERRSRHERCCRPHRTKKRQGVGAGGQSARLFACDDRCSRNVLARFGYRCVTRSSVDVEGERILGAGHPLVICAPNRADSLLSAYGPAPRTARRSQSSLGSRSAPGDVTSDETEDSRARFTTPASAR